jgi:RNA polymerase sigma factor (sigma-70 family)
MQHGIRDHSAVTSTAYRFMGHALSRISDIDDEEAVLRVAAKRGMDEEAARRHYRSYLRCTTTVSLDMLIGDNNLSTCGDLQSAPGDLESEVLTRVVLEQGIAHLPEELQRIYHARYVEELGVVEIAHAFGISTSNVSRRLARIRELLSGVLV